MFIARDGRPQPVTSFIVLHNLKMQNYSLFSGTYYICKYVELSNS